MGGYRIYLHRIHPCKKGEALFHSHPWPSAMKVLSGRYEMAIGYGASESEPPIAAKLLLGAGSEYEMTEPNGWHYVRPLGMPTMSLMVTGKPWGGYRSKSDKILSLLSSDKKRKFSSSFARCICNPTPAFNCGSFIAPVMVGLKPSPSGEGFSITCSVSRRAHHAFTHYAWHDSPDAHVKR